MRNEKKVLLSILQNSQKHVCQSLYFNKFQAPVPATLLKKRLWHSCFPVNFVKFLKTPATEYLQATASAIYGQHIFHNNVFTNFQRYHFLIMIHVIFTMEIHFHVFTKNAHNICYDVFAANT